MSSRVLFGILIALFATPASAKVVLTAARTAPVTILFGTAMMPLNDAGATSLTFSGKGRHVIKYSAECAVSGSIVSGVSIELLVDGVVSSPGGGATLCTASDTLAIDAWATAHHDFVTPVLGSGSHTVQVRVRVFGAGEQGRLDDASLVVTK